MSSTECQSSVQGDRRVNEGGERERARAGTEGARGWVKTAWLAPRPLFFFFFFLSEGLTQHDPLLSILITLFLILPPSLRLAFRAI